MKLYFCGIGGAGMASLAMLASKIGFLISGSDTSNSHRLNIIKQKTTNFYDSHCAENIHGSDVVVTSLAISSDNPEVCEAHRLSIPVWTRTECLSFLLTSKSLIAVTGSFGKSSTTSVLSDCFVASGFDPTVYLGASSENYGLGARRGDGKYAIVEACEYKNEFLSLRPAHLIVLNLHINHEDFFGHDREKLTALFERMIGLNHLSLETLWLPEDDIGSLPLIRKGYPNVKTYGLMTSEWYTDYKRDTDSGLSEISLYHHGVKVAEYTTTLFGQHLIRNLAPVLGICRTLGLSNFDIGRALSSHTPLPRRFQKIVELDKLVIVDDNARLPQQVDMTVAAGREYLGTSGIVVGVLGIWGKLNRRDLDAYATAVEKCDAVLVLPSKGFEVLEGGLEPIGSDLLLCDAIKARGVRSSILRESADITQYISPDKTLILTMGYDNFTTEFKSLTEYLTSQLDPCMAIIESRMNYV